MFVFYRSIQITTGGGLAPQVLGQWPDWQSVFEALFSVQGEAVVIPASQYPWGLPPSVVWPREFCAESDHVVLGCCWEFALLKAGHLTGTTFQLLFCEVPTSVDYRSS